MATSDLIARFILDMLNDSDGSAELQRSMLAERFNCVPSQINYVISTRFSPEQGYTVESRRGGGGYIRISRVRFDTARQLLMHSINCVGAELDAQTAWALLGNAVDAGAMDERSARLIFSALGDNALRPAPGNARDALRSSIFKHMLLQLLSD